MPRQRRRSHRLISRYVFITYEHEGRTYSINGAKVNGLNRPNPRSIYEFEKIIRKMHGVDRIQITNYKIM